MSEIDFGVDADEEQKTKVKASRRGVIKVIGAVSAAAAALSVVGHSKGETVEDSSGVNMKKMNGIEVRGIDKPYTDSQLKGEISKLNSKEISLRGDTIYTTLFVTESYLNSFQSKNGESFYDFAERQGKEMDKALKESGASMKGGFRVNRIMVVEDGVVTPDSRNREQYIDYGLRDSDGVWRFDGDYQPNKTDYPTLHEWSHAMLYLLDDYACDYTGESNLPMFQDVPTEWRSYITADRNDWSGNSIVSSNIKLNFDIYSSALLLNRMKLGRMHDYIWKFNNEFLTWPRQFPKEISLDLKDTSGRKIIPDQIEFFSSSEHFPDQLKYEKDFVGVTNFVQGDSFDPLSVINFNQAGEIPYANGTIFMRVEAGGETYWRWLDIRDLNLGYLLGYEGKCVMGMMVAGASDKKDSFDWRIVYN